MKGEAVQKWHQLNIACSLSLLAAGFLLGSWYGRSPSSTRLAAAFASARRPIGRRLTAVPLQEERLFGPPLARMQYAEGAALFEPAAYRKCAVLRARFVSCSPRLFKRCCGCPRLW